MCTPKDILYFWFSTTSQKHWFSHSSMFDAEINQHFSKTHALASQHRLDHWKTEASSALALIIVLDQFSRNLFRNTAGAYSNDSYARVIASHAISQDFDAQLSMQELSFLYMPFMHSESLIDQNRSVELFEKACLTQNLRFALHHREIIKKFGRFPHRNKALGRTHTKDEQDYLNSPKAFKG